MVHWPPLFPITLSVFSSFTGSTLGASKLVNALLFGATVLLVGLMIYESTGRSPYAAVTGSLLAFFAVPMIWLHSIVMSDPLFLFLAMLSVLLLAYYLERKSTWLLVGSALAAGLAFLTRYVGFASVVVGVVGIALWGRRDLRGKLRDAVVFAAVGVVPIAFWVIRNRPYGVTLSDRKMAWHPVNRGHVKMGLQAVLGWVYPLKQVGSGTFVLLWASILLLVAVFLRRRKAGGGTGAGHGVFLVRLLAVFAVVYTLSVIVSISLFDKWTPLDSRLLLPTFISVLVVAAYVLHGLYRASGGSAGGLLFRVSVVIVVAAILAVSMVAGVQKLGDIYAEGDGYTGREWRASETLAFARGLANSVPVYSNGGDVIYVLTGREVMGIPTKTYYPDQPALLRADRIAMVESMKGDGGVIVFFDKLERKRPPPKAEVVAKYPVRPLKTFSDGTVFVYSRKIDNARKRRAKKASQPSPGGGGR